jgi:membrane-associated protease RseP (regulator of RpoE activity)
MTEDAPLEPVAPEPELPTQPEPQADPTQPVPAATTASTAGQPTWPSPADAPPPPPKRPSTVAVPIWLVFVVGALLFGLIGFGIGWIAAPGDDHSTTIVRPGGLPNPPNGGFRIPGNGSSNGNGNGSSNGNGSGGNDQPTIPTPALRGAFLGVATEASTNPNGVKVLRVVADSPASDAGLKADDVITKVDDDTVANPQQLATRISAHQRGDKVTITYVRDGDTHTADVTLASRSSIIPSTPSTTGPGD